MTEQTLSAETDEQEMKQQPNLILWGLLAISFALLGVIFYDGLSLMVAWWDRDEYSHGFMIPFVALFLLWQKYDELPSINGQGSWWGLVLLAFSLLMFLAGELATIYTVIQYAFILALLSLFISFFGWHFVKRSWAAFAYLIFMIPLPNFLYNNLSSELQLISSEIGVWVIRLFDISVFLEGNVIDLGAMQLQVVEACSGLRYLFPLMSFGFLIAYLYNGPFWLKALLFLSTVPITVLMNSLRIGIIGVTVEYWGIQMAEGFLHDFEGWVIFVGCLGVLFFEAWLFNYFTKQKKPVLDLINLDGPKNDLSFSHFGLSFKKQQAFLAGLVLLVLSASSLSLLEERETISPDRQSFLSFPLYYKSWSGKQVAIAPDVLDELKLTDYIQANYRSRETNSFANLYVAYYDSQVKGASIHSPKSCLPGGGWQLDNLKPVQVSDVLNQSGQPLVANRAEMRMGDAAQVVYYWFEQRGRNITSEYAAKWYLFWDSLTMQRTDGALVRVIVGIEDASRIDEADQKAQQFIKDFYPVLIDHLPASGLPEQLIAEQ